MRFGRSSSIPGKAQFVRNETPFLNKAWCVNELHQTEGKKLADDGKGGKGFEMHQSAIEVSGKSNVHSFLKFIKKRGLNTTTV